MNAPMVHELSMIGILDLSRKFMFGCFDLWSLPVSYWWYLLCNVWTIYILFLKPHWTFENIHVSIRHAGTDIYLCGDPKRCPVCLGPGIRYPVNIHREQRHRWSHRWPTGLCADTAQRSNPLSACPLYPLCPLGTLTCSSYNHCPRPQTVPTPEILAIAAMAMFNKLDSFGLGIDQ